MAIVGTTVSNLVGGTEKRLAATVDFLTKTENELVRSGLTITSPETALLMQGGPRKGSIAYLNALDTSKVNTTVDDITVQGDTGNLTGDEYSCLRFDLNYGWGVTDLTKMVTQYDAKGGIQAGLAAYWDAIIKRYAVASINGVLAAGGASVSVGTAAGAFSDGLIIDAEASAEEKSEDFDILFVTPAIRALMKKAEKNAFVPASQTLTKFDEYQGKKLITTTAFGAGVTVLAKSGALAFDYGTVPGEIAIEIERLPNGAGGGGAEILHSRRSFVIHPQGANWNGSMVVPTLVQLAASAQWSIEVPVKDFGFRKIVHTATGVA